MKDAQLRAGSMKRPVPRAFASLVFISLLSISRAGIAGVLFTDGFESGDRSFTENGVSWIDHASTLVSTDRAYTGKYSLKFIFVAGANGADAWAEQRISLPQRGDYWFGYKLYIPTNYVHRSQSDAANNKFLAVYRAPYEKPGFQVNFSLQPNGSGGSNLEIHHYNNGAELGVIPSASNIITDADKGKWMDLVVEVKVASGGSSNDGVMRLWKNGTQLVNVTNLAAYGGSGANYIDQAYFLGWSNSGFAQETDLYIDDVRISDTPISPGGTTNPTPQAPNLTVQ